MCLEIVTIIQGLAPAWNHRTFGERTFILVILIVYKEIVFIVYQSFILKSMGILPVVPELLEAVHGTAVDVVIIQVGETNLGGEVKLKYNQ